MQKQMTVFIGCFSPFHLGHEEVLLRALKSSEVVLLLIGSSFVARNIKNPFTFDERRVTIYNWYQNKLLKNKVGRLEIRPLRDYPYNDQKWIAQVQETVLNVKEEYNISRDTPVYLTGAQRDTSTWYLNTFGSFFTQDFVSESRLGFDESATNIRNDLFNDGYDWEYKTPQETINFIDKFKESDEFVTLKAEWEFVNKYRKAWLGAPYAPTFVCVDACVVQSGHVLVIVRDSQPGRGLWALPGGFVEQNEKLIDAAVRELIEETSIGLSKAQLYGSIQEKEIFDHPDRSLRGRTLTTCFLFSLKNDTSLPKIKGQTGEVQKLMWMPIAEALANSEKWYEDHHSILETMISRIKN